MTQLDNRSSEAGQKVLTTAAHLKTIADQLRSDELTGGAACLADRGAATLERVGHYLDASNGDRLIADAERFGRERPWVLAGAGLALGLAGSRMIKASAARGSASDYDVSRYTGAGGYAVSGGGGAATGNDYRNPVSSDAAPMTAATQGASGVTASQTSRPKTNDGP